MISVRHAFPRRLPAAARLAFAMLVVVDVSLVLLHLLHRGGRGAGARLRDDRYSLEHDRGVAEQFGYEKQLFLVVVLLLLARRLRAPVYAAWTFTFAAVLVDDAFFLHERVGEDFARRLDLPAVAGLEPWDVGELVFWSLLGLVVLTALATGYGRSAPVVRAETHPLFLLFAMLLVVAIGLDVVHVLVPEWADSAAAVLEDGGELVVLSATVAYGVALADRHSVLRDGRLWIVVVAMLIVAFVVAASSFAFERVDDRIGAALPSSARVPTALP